MTSTDGGSSWSATNSGTGSVMALAIDPTRPDTVYAGTAYYGVLNSTDGGGTWGGGNYGQFMETRIFALAIDPKTPRTLYAAGDSVFKSTDAGATWRTLSAGLTNGNAHALAIAPTTPGSLYAGTDDGVFSIQPVHCTGDCNGDGGVAVSEMVTGVNIALGSVPVNACSSFDAGDDARVTIDDLIVAVNNALKGCATEGTE